MGLKCALLPLTGWKRALLLPRWVRVDEREEGGESLRWRGKTDGRKDGGRDKRATEKWAGQGLREEETREEGE